MKIKIDSLDTLFSRYIRSRAFWACERCGKSYPPPTISLQCSHFHGRRKQSVRFDPENCAALCSGCHAHFGANPLLHTQWFQKRLGEERFNRLLIRANKPGAPDRELIKIWLKEQLKTNRKQTCIFDKPK